MKIRIPGPQVSTLLLSTIFLTLLTAVAAAQDVAGCPTTSTNNVCLTTYQGGISRLGYNSSEPTLTQAAITATSGEKFKKEYSVAVNGAIYAQPLVLPNVTISGTTYADVAYVATEQNWVYAIDGASGKILWSTNLSPKGYKFLKSSDVNGCANILPSPGDIGVTGTPVIDISGNKGQTTITSGVLYVVAKLKTSGTPYSYKQTLYALSIIDGGNGVSATTPYASVDISGTFNGISFNQGTVGTNPPYSLTQNQRGALLALPESGQNPEIVITWGAHCDHTNFPYNGWMMAYQLNAAQTALTQTAIWASVPSKTSYEGGIWAGGSGPAADSSGHIFLSVGNGDSNVKISLPPNDNPTSCTKSPCDYGNSILEFQLLGNSFSVLDFFTAYDWTTRNKYDYDLGAGGLMLLPTQENGNPENLLAQAGKEGNVYLAQTSPTGSLGGYTGNGASDSTTQALYHPVCYDDSQECGIWGSPAWWNTTSGGGGSTGYAYFGGKNLGIMQFQFYPTGSSCTKSNGKAGFCTTPTATTSHTFSWPGPTPTVSTASTTATQAIVWAIDSHRALSGGVAGFWAFDATKLTCLYTTDQGVSKSSCTRKGASTDVPSGIAVKFSVPSVANGKVYVGTAGGTSGGYLNIYGIE